MHATVLSLAAKTLYAEMRDIALAGHATDMPDALMRKQVKGSDCQYCSNDFQALLRQYDMRSSMSRKGDCWNNAVAESFFHSFKVEAVQGE